MAVPYPLVRKDEKWSFDTKAGLDEILRRRIGRNELSAIQVSLAYVQAQNEYASLDPDKLGTHVYAQRIVSSEGKKDGLYWPTAEGEEPSRSAISRRKQPPKVIRRAESPSPITAITTVFSSARAEMPPAAPTTTWSTAR